MGAHAPVLLVPTSMDRIVAFYYKTKMYIANPIREYKFQQYMQGFSLGEPRRHTPLQNLLKFLELSLGDIDRGPPFIATHEKDIREIRYYKTTDLWKALQPRFPSYR